MTLKNPIAATILKINSTWIVRADLDSHTEQFLSELHHKDPKRFEMSVTFTKEVVETLPTVTVTSTIDPKPFFYAAIFSFSNKEEQSKYLESHAFTKAILEARHDELDPESLPFDENTLKRLFLVANFLNHLEAKAS